MLPQMWQAGARSALGRQITLATSLKGVQSWNLTCVTFNKGCFSM